MLIDHGVSINITNNWGDTPVHDAASKNSTKAISMLIDHGASINIMNNDGDKPIDKARRWKNKAPVRMLKQL